MQIIGYFEYNALCVCVKYCGSNHQKLTRKLQLLLGFNKINHHKNQGCKYSIISRDGFRFKFVEVDLKSSIPVLTKQKRSKFSRYRPPTLHKYREVKQMSRRGKTKQGGDRDVFPHPRTNRLEAIF